VTPDRRDENSDEQAEHGLLADTTNVDTAGIGILGARTAHVSLTLPAEAEDERVHDEAVDDVAEEADAVGPAHDSAASDAGAPAADEIDDVATGEIVVEDEPVARPGATPGAEADEDVHDAEIIDEGGSDDPAAVTPKVDADDDAAVEGAANHPADTDAALDQGTGTPGEPRDDAASVAGETKLPSVTAPAAPGAPTPARATSVPIGEPVPLTGAVPTTRRQAHHGDEQRGDRAHAVERVHPPQQGIDLASKRLGEFEPDRESADLLTADRLLDRGQISGAEPEGLWQQFVYSLSRHRINLGDSRKVRERKDLDRRIAAALPGGARFVPVLSRKGGVGKTTVTTLLGMALASARDDRVIAIDANPDRGTLADRIGRTGGRTVRDLARVRGEVTGFNDISTIVARDQTRLDVLASDADPRVSEAFSDRDYHDVAAVAAHYYSIVLTDTGTGIVHSVMGATLELADQIVVVAGLSVDEARLASETLTWLETNGYAEQVRRAVVVLNNARPGTPLVRESELERHFGTRVRTVVRLPYDPLIGSGSDISFHDLQPATRHAARQLAAAVVEGLRAGVVAA
jgi:MinD-like ATPase involved in chromosome partitioning or flagellar assembly